jgi:hypothetical protein
VETSAHRRLTVSTSIFRIENSPRDQERIRIVNEFTHGKKCKEE